jgi:hypothetical protein
MYSRFVRNVAPKAVRSVVVASRGVKSLAASNGVKINPTVFALPRVCVRSMGDAPRLTNPDVSFSAVNKLL